MTALILGASGMLGSALMRRIPGAIGVRRAHVDLNPVPGMINCNLFNVDQIREVFRLYEFTEVYHCAGLVGGITANMNNQYEFLMQNAKMAINVIDVAKDFELKNLYYISSSCVYPVNCQQPMKEDYILSGPPEPTNGGYAMAKLLGMAAAKYAGYSTMIPCNLYGPNDNYGAGGHVLASLVRKVCDAKRLGSPSITVWGDGTARREFLHVDDCADAIVAATKIDSQTTNIGSGVDLSIAELAHLIARIAEWDGDIVFDPTMPNGMMRKLLDVSLLNAAGWKQKVTFESGIAQMISQYHSNTGKEHNR